MDNNMEVQIEKDKVEAMEALRKAVAEAKATGEWFMED